MKTIQNNFIITCVTAKPIYTIEWKYYPGTRSLLTHNIAIMDGGIVGVRVC